MNASFVSVTSFPQGTVALALVPLFARMRPPSVAMTSLAVSSVFTLPVTVQSFCMKVALTETGALAVCVSATVTVHVAPPVPPDGQDDHLENE